MTAMHHGSVVFQDGIYDCDSERTLLPLALMAHSLLVVHYRHSMPWSAIPYEVLTLVLEARDQR